MLTAAESIALSVIRDHAPLDVASLPAMIGARGVRPSSADAIVIALLRRALVFIDAGGRLRAKVAL